MFKSIDTLGSFDKTIEGKSTNRWLTKVGLHHKTEIIKKSNQMI